ncbi:DUF3108 domain-containing protein [Marinilabiliaceae bacterium JC017]|nr:DUF3108 domain-containing protein [Marinilabiliaceae bacterium JC017]
MNRIATTFFVSILLFFIFFCGDNIKLKVTNHQAYQPGEELKFTVNFGFITGGVGYLIVKDTLLGNQNVHHIIAKGQTIGIADVLYKIRDQYESFVHPSSNYPVKAIRSIREGGYRYYNEVLYYRDSTMVMSQKSGSHVVPEDILDILSAFYYARNHNFNDDMQVGDVIEFITYFSDELFPLRIRFRGTEVIKTNFGNIECYKFSPVTEVGRAFKTEDDMHIWISRDKNRIPVRIKFNLVVGSFTCNLSEFKGLKHPFSSVRP